MTTPELLVVVGPTASGKTQLALRLVREQPSEIVSADSVQVYRDFEIGTGKPDAEARRQHHLIDVRDPLEPMDAATWAEMADATILDIRARGKRPIVCGGTFLWVKALLFGLASAPPADEALRERHRRLAEEEGRVALHAELAKVDPTCAKRLNPNDFIRVSRALEVHELTGIPMSQWQREHGFQTPRYQARLVGIDWPREELDARIRRRTEEMFEQGFVEEVRMLLARGYRDARAMRSVGYRQIAGALAPPDNPDSTDRGEPESAELRDAVYRATRVFARRQRTWLRDQPVDWLSPQSALRS